MEIDRGPCDDSASLSIPILKIFNWFKKKKKENDIENIKHYEEVVKDEIHT